MSRRGVLLLLSVAVVVAIVGYVSSYLQSDRVSSELTLVLVEGEVNLKNRGQDQVVA